MSYKPGPNQPDIKHDIKRKGALTNRADSHGRTVEQQAQADIHKPGLPGEQARYYENVLKPAAKPKHWSGH